jgi:hypothetical protein
MYTYIKTNENGENLECFISSEIKPSYNPTAKESECDEYKRNYEKWENELQLVPFADDIHLTNVYQKTISDYNIGNFSEDLKSYIQVDCIQIIEMFDDSRIEHDDKNTPSVIFSFKKLAYFKNKNVEEEEEVNIKFITDWTIEQAATKYIQSHPKKSSWRAYIEGANHLKNIYENEICRLKEELEIRSHELHMSKVKILDKSKEYRDNITKLKSNNDTFAINFIKAVMSKTEWRPYDEDASNWTDGDKIISVERLLELYKKDFENGKID